MLCGAQNIRPAIDVVTFYALRYYTKAILHTPKKKTTTPTNFNPNSTVYCTIASFPSGSTIKLYKITFITFVARKIQVGHHSGHAIVIVVNIQTLSMYK